MPFGNCSFEIEFVPVETYDEATVLPVTNYSFSRCLSPRVSNGGSRISELINLFDACSNNVEPLLIATTFLFRSQAYAVPVRPVQGVSRLRQ